MKEGRIRDKVGVRRGARADHERYGVTGGKRIIA
jgi:hypothetical protein